MKKKIIIIVSIIFLIMLFSVVYILYLLNYIPHKKYDNEHFNIETYISNVDKDKDGIDD